MSEEKKGIKNLSKFTTRTFSQEDLDKMEKSLKLMEELEKEIEEKYMEIILMSEKINQAYFEENDFYLWFEKEFGILPNGHYEEIIRNYFEKIVKRKNLNKKE